MKTMLKKLLTLGVFLIAGVSVAQAEMTQVPAFNGGLNSKDMATCNQKVAPVCKTTASMDRVECLRSRMKKTPQCTQSLAFLNLTNGTIKKIKHERHVDVVYAEVAAADHSDDFFMVGHAGEFVPLTEQIDIKTTPGYQMAVAHFPAVTLWTMTTTSHFPKSVHLKNGGERLVFKQQLTNQCRACERAGVAEVAYDFDATGKFMGAKALRLVVAEKKQH